jgi:hypothetical protein
MIAALITHEKRVHNIGDIDQEILSRKKEIFRRKKDNLESQMVM